MTKGIIFLGLVAGFAVLVAMEYFRIRCFICECRVEQNEAFAPYEGVNYWVCYSCAQEHGMRIAE